MTSFCPVAQKDKQGSSSTIPFGQHVGGRSQWVIGVLPDRPL